MTSIAQTSRGADSARSGSATLRYQARQSNFKCNKWHIQYLCLRCNAVLHTTAIFRVLWHAYFKSSGCSARVYFAYTSEYTSAMYKSVYFSSSALGAVRHRTAIVRVSWHAPFCSFASGIMQCCAGQTCYHGTHTSVPPLQVQFCLGAIQCCTGEPQSSVHSMHSSTVSPQCNTPWAASGYRVSRHDASGHRLVFSLSFCDAMQWCAGRQWQEPCWACKTQSAWMCCSTRGILIGAGSSSQRLLAAPPTL